MQGFALHRKKILNRFLPGRGRSWPSASGAHEPLPLDEQAHRPKSSMRDRQKAMPAPHLSVPPSRPSAPPRAAPTGSA